MSDRDDGKVQRRRMGSAGESEDGIEEAAPLAAASSEMYSLLSFSDDEEGDPYEFGQNMPAADVSGPPPAAVASDDDDDDDDIVAVSPPHELPTWLDTDDVFGENDGGGDDDDNDEIRVAHGGQEEPMRPYEDHNRMRISCGGMYLARPCDDPSRLVIAIHPNTPGAAEIMDPDRERVYPDNGRPPPTRALPATEKGRCPNPVPRLFPVGRWKFLREQPGTPVGCREWFPSLGKKSRALSFVLPASALIKHAPTIAHVNLAADECTRKKYLAFQLFMLYMLVSTEGRIVLMLRGDQSIVFLGVTHRPVTMTSKKTPTATTPDPMFRLRDLFRGARSRDAYDENAEFLPVTVDAIVEATGCSKEEAAKFSLYSQSNGFDAHKLHEIMRESEYADSEEKGADLFSYRGANNIEYMFGNSRMLDRALERDRFLRERIRLISRGEYGNDSDSDDDELGDEDSDMATPGGRKRKRPKSTKLIRNMGIDSAILDISMQGLPFPILSPWRHVMPDIAPSAAVMERMAEREFAEHDTAEMDVYTHHGSEVYNRLAEIVLDHDATPISVQLMAGGSIMLGVPAIHMQPATSVAANHVSRATYERHRTPAATARALLRALKQSVAEWNSDRLPPLKTAVDTLSSKQQRDVAKKFYRDLQGHGTPLFNLGDALCCSSAMLVTVMNAVGFIVSNNSERNMLIGVVGRPQEGKSAALVITMRVMPSLRVDRTDDSTKLAALLCRNSRNTIHFSDDSKAWISDDKEGKHADIRFRVSRLEGQSQSYDMGRPDGSTVKVTVKPGMNVDLIIENDELLLNPSEADRFILKQIAPRPIKREQVLRAIRGDSADPDSAPCTAYRVLISAMLVILVAIETFERSGNTHLLADAISDKLTVAISKFSVRDDKNVRMMERIGWAVRRFTAIRLAVEVCTTNTPISAAVAKAISEGPLPGDVIQAALFCSDNFAAGMQHMRARWKKVKLEQRARKSGDGSAGFPETPEAASDYVAGYSAMPSSLPKSMARDEADKPFISRFLKTHCSQYRPPVPRPDFQPGSRRVGETWYHSDLLESYCLTAAASELLLEIFVVLETKCRSAIAERMEDACGLYSVLQCIMAEEYFDHVAARHPGLPRRKVVRPDGAEGASRDDVAASLVRALTVDVSAVPEIADLLRARPSVAAELEQLRVGPHRQPVLQRGAAIGSGGSHNKASAQQVRAGAAAASSGRWSLRLDGLLNYCMDSRNGGYYTVVYDAVPVVRPFIVIPLTDSDPVLFGSVKISSKVERLLARARKLPLVSMSIRDTCVVSRMPTRDEVETAQGSTESDVCMYEDLMTRGIDIVEVSRRIERARWDFSECADGSFYAEIQCTESVVDVMPAERDLDLIPYALLAAGAAANF